MAYVGGQNGGGGPATASSAADADGLISVHARLAQNRVLAGSEGKISVALKLAAATLPAADPVGDTPVDLVVVLDRSGSMGGEKINDARAAILQLVDRLTIRDRLALVSYADEVTTNLGLMAVDGSNRNHFIDAVHQIHAGGGTNLGGGLQRGIATIMAANAAGRQRKVILISDGLANKGITDPDALGRMASAAQGHRFSISSVGVGHDFNEVLMTSLADYGSGRYYFLENPQAFAQVFDDEFQTARRVAASGLTLHIPLHDGIRLIHAGGYPIAIQNGAAVLHPGDLLSGQERQIFLTFQVPTDRETELHFGDIQVSYRHQGVQRILDAGLNLAVACVPDPEEVAASVDEEVWSRQVLQEDFSRLKAAVADAIRKGERTSAEQQIRDYEATTRQLNAAVGSAAVAQNLEKDIPQLRESVKETFSGAPADVAVKRKQQAKTLQYDSYQKRRDQKK